MLDTYTVKQFCLIKGLIIASAFAGMYACNQRSTMLTERKSCSGAIAYSGARHAIGTYSDSEAIKKLEAELELLIRRLGQTEDVAAVARSQWNLFAAGDMEYDWRCMFSIPWISLPDVELVSEWEFKMGRLTIDKNTLGPV